MRDRSDSAMPMPVSVTVMSTSGPPVQARTVTLPPSGVNLTALPMRLSRTCLSRSSSAVMWVGTSAASKRSSTPSWPARSRTSASTLWIASPAGKVVTSSSMRPASTFDRSSTSLSRARRWRPASRMSCTYSAWRSLSSPNIRSSSTSENPMTALSGVRSSCDMLARKSDLCWLVVASSRLWSSSCWYRRALVRATADWLAKAVSMSHVSSLNAPVVIRRTTSAPDDALRPGQRDRPPASASPRRRGPSGGGRARPRTGPGTCTGTPDVAARPTRDSSTWILEAFRRSSTALLVP